jgi:hypothetical protein
VRCPQVWYPNSATRMTSPVPSVISVK